MFDKPFPDGWSSIGEYMEAVLIPDYESIAVYVMEILKSEYSPEDREGVLRFLVSLSADDVSAEDLVLTWEEAQIPVLIQSSSGDITPAIITRTKEMAECAKVALNDEFDGTTRRN